MDASLSSRNGPSVQCATGTESSCNYTIPSRIYKINLNY